MIFILLFPIRFVSGFEPPFGFPELYASGRPYAYGRVCPQIYCLFHKTSENLLPFRKSLPFILHIVPLLYRFDVFKELETQKKYFFN